MTGYVLSPAARSDLDAIWDYTADRWDLDQAERYTRDIQAACRSLAADTKAGRPMEHVRAGYFKLGIGSHFIVYRKVGGRIDVIRILHQRMDLPSRLGD